MSDQLPKRRHLVGPLILAFILGLGVFYFVAFPASRPPPDKPAPGPVEKIDFVLFESKSDNFGGVAEAAERGAILASEKINRAGGVLGKSIVMRSENISNTAPTAAPALFALFAGSENEKPLAIAWAIAKKTPLLILTDGPCRTVSPSTPTSETASPYLWSLGLTWQTTVEPLFVYLNDIYSRPDKPFTVTYLGGDTEPSRRMIDAARDEAESLSFTTVDSQFFDVRLADYFPAIRNILGHAPHVLFVSNPGLPGRVFMQQAAKLGVGKEMAIASLDSFEPEFYDSDDHSLEGVYTVGKYSRELPGESNAAFIAGLKERGAPEYVLSGSTAAMSFAAVELAARAFKKAGKNDPDAFAAALAGLEYSAPHGKVRMNALNHVLEQPLFVMQREKGSWKVRQDLGTAVHPRLEGCGGITNQGIANQEGAQPD